jgi:hypothetical protein
MLILLIIGIILFILGILIGVYFNVNPTPTFFILFGFMLIVNFIINNENEPTAMDVYKGKTTLEITYKDSIPIDSVVVFKDKEK